MNQTGGTTVRFHGSDLRGLDPARPPTLSPLLEGRFGRMFRRLPPAPQYSPDQLRELAQTMRDTDSPSGAWGGQIEDRDNESIPAAYTYLGQFVDHDITFDPMSDLQKVNDPDALVDFRTPRFDLDSLYGSGPADEPFQYEAPPVPEDPTPTRFLLNVGTLPTDVDMPRNKEGTALIGDPRNDENIIVSQLHVAFLRAHNKFVDALSGEASLRFREAQRLTRWHYQFIVVNDYLRKIVGDDVMNEVLTQDDKTGVWNIKRRFYRPQKNAYMPVEFSVAAFRFGHSMVRGIYNLNDVVRDRPIFAPGDNVGPLEDLRGRRELPDQWGIAWKDFLSINGSAPQPSRKIDARLVSGLFDLPRTNEGLAFLNLMRGQAFALPSGQDVAKALGNAAIAGDDLETSLDPTPLWFYILKESDLQTGGLHLGRTGARIVAEVLLGLLETDSQSYFAQDPNWTPTTEGIVPDADADGIISLADFVSWATT